MQKKLHLDAFTIFAYIFISLTTLICIVPFWLLIVGSITDNNELIAQGY